jgi:hypothetical protein
MQSKFRPEASSSAGEKGAVLPNHRPKLASNLGSWYDRTMFDHPRDELRREGDKLQPPLYSRQPVLALYSPAVQQQRILDTHSGD